ncbi:MAG: SRPBCC family protein [Candidatus Calescibacterium sp.]|nr:SRPBCC family protein [Candidatus Calescibacterium sp.]MCX7971760.1 SRPBCC family protein [bacterium]MDW8195366.1 SRPBCC family protein [Candidatus Calescibacterium sp.]
MVIKEEIDVSAPASLVYSVASDTEKFPEFMPDVKSVKIIEKNGNFQKTQWEADVDGIVFKWEEEEIFYPEKMYLEYKLIKGDIDKFEGYWQVISVNEKKSKLVLYLDFDVNIPMLSSLIMPTIKQKVRKNAQLMLKAIKERAESLVV